jgi:AbrB family looped-hinge helix DNA binding protein
MKTTVTSRGQVSIPAEIRRRLSIKPRSTVAWEVEGSTARVIPIPEDPIRAIRGRMKPGAVARLLADRRRDRLRNG